MRYVLLLRGINVGGKNKVSMDDLKNYYQMQALKMYLLISTAEIYFSAVSKVKRIAYQK